MHTGSGNLKENGLYIPSLDRGFDEKIKYRAEIQPIWDVTLL